MWPIQTVKVTYIDGGGEVGTGIINADLPVSREEC